MYEDLQIKDENLKERLIKSIKNQLEVYAKHVKGEEEKELMKEALTDEFISGFAQKYVDYFDEKELSEILTLQEHPMVPKLLEFQQIIIPWVMEKMIAKIEELDI